MDRSFVLRLLLLLSVSFSLHSSSTFAQSGNSGTITGVVKDPSGAVVAKVTVEIHNPVSGYERSTATDASGNFSFSNIPLNPYHLSATAKGFGSFAQDVDVRSSVPVTVEVGLTVAGTASTVTVEGGGDLIENDSTFHTDVDRALFDKLPLESASSSVSSLVTLSTPGVAADSNGLFHGLGDHAENSFSVDGQPITDQQSKVFSNQIPLDSIQSLEVISGAPPAEYGDKTSLIINVTTRSGQGETIPHGSVRASYGSFGSVTGGFDLGYGGEQWGNFISVDGLNSGRFLDPPEFTVMHDKGNEENVFDRVDYQLTNADSLHLNAGYSRSWFQTPNSFDAQNATPWSGVVVANGGLDPNGNVVGPTDQRSKIGTFNVAPTWNRLFSSTTVLTAGFFVRRDAYNYYPSGDPFADLGPSNLQQETVSQDRTLLNAGARASLSYVKGIHNVKAGVILRANVLDGRRSFRNRRSHAQRTLPRRERRSGVCRQSYIEQPVAMRHSQHNEPGAVSSSVCGQRTYGDLTRVPSDPGLHRPHQDALSCGWVHHECHSLISRPHGREATRHVCPGHDHGKELVVQLGNSRRYLQRFIKSHAGGTSPRSCLQHQADEYSPPHFVCKNSRIPFQ